MTLCRLMGSRKTLFIPKAFFSLVAAPWVLFSTSSGQYSWTFSCPAGSQAWNWQDRIKGATPRITAAALHPLLPWDKAPNKVIQWKPLGEGEKETAFMSDFLLEETQSTA